MTMHCTNYRMLHPPESLLSPAIVATFNALGRGLVSPVSFWSILSLVGFINFLHITSFLYFISLTNLLFSLEVMFQYRRNNYTTHGKGITQGVTFGELKSRVILSD